ncbi:carboxypeptidase D [Malassezia yamatoensis]|uniref:Carboxypeptidase n=1 Tax=Malassezia yamatoensis TaxID=253288 RepID=A0AAJ5YSW8_9BASI|nr:carboxypeptidase D [Malassezia yamatoensis]
MPNSWAGEVSVSKDEDDHRYFFWLWEPQNDVGHEDLVIWLNGGPGCSSLEGLFEENGPFTFTHGEDAELKLNPYSWTNLSYVMWVESPIGVGFTEGQPSIRGEKDLGREFHGFLDEFFSTFPELKNKRLWLTGESYAGMYIPYIAHELYQNADKHSGINLQGIAINDPSFTDTFFGEEAPAFEFLEKNYRVMGLQREDVESVRNLARQQGLETYIADHLQYPPRGPINPPDQYNPEKSIWTQIADMAQGKSDCFSIYNIKPNCEYESDPLGMPLQSQQPSDKNFINDTPGLKEAIHVDPSVRWVECTSDNVFQAARYQQDTSTPPDQSVLPMVIEKSKKTVIQHGTYDFVLIANGSALAIQNMTWSGTTGFQSPPNIPIRFEGRMHGMMGEERGLTFVLVNGAGHMIPEFKPKTAYKLQQYLLGQLDRDGISK